MATTERLRIGAFSTLCRLSVRMLRYYDAHSILQPATTDETTGYRYYAASQLVDEVLIRQLRDVGFSVSAIAALLPLRHDLDALDRALRVQRDQLLADASQVQRRIADLDHLVSTLPEDTMTTITTTTLPAQRVAALRMIIANYHSERIAWYRLMAECARQNIVPGPEPCGATFFDDGYQEADVDVAVWIPISDDVAVAQPLLAEQQPAQRVAAATLCGPYDAIPAACDALAA